MYLRRKLCDIAALTFAPATSRRLLL